MLDVMVAVDQGCGCSDLLLKREVVIWIPTCEDRMSVINIWNLFEKIIITNSEIH